MGAFSLLTRYGPGGGGGSAELSIPQHKHFTIIFLISGSKKKMIDFTKQYADI